MSSWLGTPAPDSSPAGSRMTIFHTSDIQSAPTVIVQPSKPEGSVCCGL